MGESWIFDVVFRGVSELGDVQSDLEGLVALNLKLQNENLKYQQEYREAATERKKVADDARQALVNQINAELGIRKELDSQMGIIEQLKNRIKILKSEREKADSVESIQVYNNALQESQAELSKLTGVTQKFKETNTFWETVSGHVAEFFSLSQISEWGGKILTAQSSVEGLGLSLKMLLGEGTAKQIQQELKTLIIDTSLSFETAVEGVEKLAFAYDNAGLSTKTIVKDFEAFGNVARGSEENLKGIIKGLEDTGSEGKLTTEVIDQFGSVGVNILTLLAESTGKSAKEIEKMEKAGTLSFNLVRDALVKAGSEGGKFAGSMAIATSTVTGQWAKLQDTLFFAMASVGDSFADSAKKVLSWGTSLINTFFGTQKVAEATVNVLKTLAVTIGAYAISTKVASVAGAAWTGIQKAGLIIKGEATLAMYALSGATTAQMRSTMAATTAARTFNATLVSNPIGLVVLAIGTLVTAYQAYNLLAEKANEEQNKLNQSIADSIAPLQLEQAEFNKLANEVLKGTVPLQKQYDTLETLKKQHPELLKGITDLADAERILNEHKIKVNTEDSYRLERLEELKKKFPEQLKGINTLKEAEEKLSGVLKEVNADFATRALLLEADIKYNLNKEKATKLIKDQIVAEENLGKLKIKLARERSVLSLEEDSEQQLASRIRIINYEEQQKQYEGTIRAQKAGVINLIGVNQSIAKIQEDAKKSLHYNYEEQVKITQNGEGKKTKEKINSKAVQALIEEKSANDSLERTRTTELESLRIQREIDLKRLSESKASAAKKKSDLVDIEANYGKDVAQLKLKWDKKEQEATRVSLDLINTFRADFRALNTKEDVKGFQLRAKQIEEHYKLEIDQIQKSNKSLTQKAVEITKLIIVEEKELATVKNQIEFVKNLDKLHGQQAATLKKLAADYVSKAEVQRDVDKEQIDHQREMIKLYAQRSKAIQDVITSIIPESKELFNYTNAVEKSSQSLKIFSEEKEKLNEIQKKSGIQSKEFIEQLKVTNKAEQDSVKDSNDLLQNQYTLVLKVAQAIIKEIKQSVINAAKVLGQAVRDANEIYQNFAKQQRDAEVAAYKTSLAYELSLTKDNYDKRIVVLEKFLLESEDLIRRIALGDEIAQDFQKAADGITNITNMIVSMMEDSKIRNAISTTVKIFNSDIINASNATIADSQRVISRLQIQRDETITLLDEIASAYREKYDDMIDTVKEGLADQLDEIKENAKEAEAAVREGLNKQLDALSSWYDKQRDFISDKYQGLIDNKKRIDDKYFDGYIETQVAARDTSEGIAEGEKNAQIAALKERYKNEEITLDEYIQLVQGVESSFYTKRIEDRGVFYDNLREAATGATNKEIDDLKVALAEGKITQEQYDTDLGVIQNRGAQRFSEINDLIKGDRNDDLTDLKTNYLDVKVMAEQKAATDIKAIVNKSKDDIKAKEKEANDEIIRLTLLRNTQLEALAKKRLYTELSYNAAIFEQNRSLALAQANLALVEAKAAAWKNPITALFVIGKIKDAFAEIFAQIRSAENPFQSQMEYNSIQDSKNAPVENPDPNVLSFKDGTDRLPNKSGKTGVDTELIRADVGERIIPTHLNDTLKGVFGKDIANVELISRAIQAGREERLAFSAMASNFPRINYTGIVKLHEENKASELNMLSELSKKLDKLENFDKMINKLDNLKQVNVSVRNGVPTIEERQNNRMLRYS